MLGIRLRTGLPLDVLTGSERHRARRAVDEDLATETAGRLVLTARGRLLADAVVRDILDD